MKNLAIIPIRSGSQRIKHKNIKLLAGHPLVYYQIDCAKKVKDIDKIIVATDDDYYADICKSMGVEIINRPPEVSGPNSKTEDVMLYVIDELEKKGEVYDNIILLQATSPLNKPEYIQEGLDAIKSGKYKSVLTYCDFKRYLLDDSNIISRPMTQKMIPKKMETGCFWITNIDELKKTKNRICEPYYMVKVDENAGWVDIDNEDEMRMIEALLIPRVREEEGKYYKKREYEKEFDEFFGSKEDPDGKLKDNTNIQNYNIDFYKQELEFVNNLGKDNKERKILDLGCGIGFASSKINGNFKKFGLEVSKNAAEIAKNYIDEVHIGELKEDTYPEEFFDVVFCHHVIEHVKDPLSFVRIIKKIMKTHGILVMGTPNFDSAMARRFKENFRLLHDDSHISLFSDFTLKEMLEDNGFHVEKIEYPFFETSYFTKDNLDRLFDISKVSPAFYGNVMTFYCKKK